MITFLLLIALLIAPRLTLLGLAVGALAMLGHPVLAVLALLVGLCVM